MSVKFKLKRKKVQPQFLKYDMKILKQDEVRQKYNIEVKNGFELLFRDETYMDDETRWNNIKETLIEAIKSTVSVQVIGITHTRIKIINACRGANTLIASKSQHVVLDKKVVA